jgi:hypothetical protein
MMLTGMVVTLGLLAAACGLDGPRARERDGDADGAGGAPPGDEPPPGDDPEQPPPEQPPPEQPPPEEPPPLRCVADGAEGVLFDATDREVARYDDVPQCEQVVEAAGEGVVCAWFTPGMPVGPGAWGDETGWRPMNVATEIGLGRVPHLSFDDCLAASANARGGVVCTNTAVGYKSAHIETNTWCGASSNLAYCLQASLAARDFHVCSFPSSGDGSEPGWVLTEIAGTECDYLTSSMPLDECNALVPAGQ